IHPSDHLTITYVAGYEYRTVLSSLRQVYRIEHDEFSLRLAFVVTPHATCLKHRTYHVIKNYCVLAGDQDRLFCQAQRLPKKILTMRQYGPEVTCRDDGKYNTSIRCS